MEIIKNRSGYYEHHLTEREQNILMNIINKPLPKQSYFTPQDNFKYDILSEKELEYTSLSEIAPVTASAGEFPG